MMMITTYTNIFFFVPSLCALTHSCPSSQPVSHKSIPTHFSQIQPNPFLPNPHQPVPPHAVVVIIFFSPLPSPPCLISVSSSQRLIFLPLFSFSSPFFFSLLVSFLFSSSRPFFCFCLYTSFFLFYVPSFLVSFSFLSICYPVFSILDSYYSPFSFFLSYIQLSDRWCTLFSCSSLFFLLFLVSFSFHFSPSLSRFSFLYLSVSVSLCFYLSVSIFLSRFSSRLSSLSVRLFLYVHFSILNKRKKGEATGKKGGYISYVYKYIIFLFLLLVAHFVTYHTILSWLRLD